MPKPLITQAVLEILKNGPKSAQELGITVPAARQLESEGLVQIDPDKFPDECVPGNPLVLRLPGDDSQWPGWKTWNV